MQNTIIVNGFDNQKGRIIMTTVKNVLTMESMPEFIGQIVDIFEDYCTEKEIILENSDRNQAIKDGEDPENLAIIYGDSYDVIGDAIRRTLSEHTADPAGFVMRAFLEVLMDGGYKEELPAADVEDLKKNVRETYAFWNAGMS